MRHHSCTRAAGGRGVCRFFNQHQLYELLLCLRYSVRLLPPSPALPLSVRSCFVSLRRSACKWVNPTARSHPPNPQCTPGTKTSMGSQFPDTQWSLNLRGSNPFSLCTRPPFWCFNPHPPTPVLSACPPCCVSWCCSRGFQKHWGWTDRRTAGFVFSVRLVNKPGQILFHAPTSATLDGCSWTENNPLQICYSN